VDDVLVDLAFPADYEVRPLDELPPAGRCDHEYARDARGVSDGGVLFAVTGADGEWSGVVANGPRSVREAYSGIHSTPSAREVCIVARGEAYFIDVDAPDRWWVLPDFPVVAVRSSSAERLLLLATPWRVIAVHRGDVAWRTARLAIDGISLGEPAAGLLTGVADPREEPRDFAIDLRTGRHTGGAPLASDA
jgi:hypothetical protein